MLLSDIFEARDSEYEKQIEPKLRSPISMYTGATSPQRKIKQKLHDTFKPKWGQGDNIPGFYDMTHPHELQYSETPRNPYPASARPRGYVPSIVGPGDLNRAVSYWVKNFDGERWSALEQAFLNRARSYTGGGGDFVRPRTSIFTYLANLKEPWPEGEALVQKFLGSSGMGTKHAKDTSNYIGYSLKKGTFDPSEASPRALAQYYNKNFKGQRWEPLEQSFMAQSPSPDQVLSYLKKLSEPWPEGDSLIHRLLSDELHGSMIPYFPDQMQYVMDHKIRNPKLDVVVKKCLQAEKPKRVYTGPELSDEDEFETRGVVTFGSFQPHVAELLRQYGTMWDIKP